MDIFKQKRNYIVTIVILVIINVITLLLLWIGKPKHSMRGPEGAVTEKVRIQEMLKKELGFSIEQTEQFIKLRESHRSKSNLIEEEIMLLKKEMFDQAMLTDDKNISDSLLNLSLAKQSQLERSLFEHFQKLKDICTPEQRKKLFSIIHTMIGPPQQGGPPPGEIPENSPHGEFRDRKSPIKGERPNGPPPRGERPPKRN